MKNYQIKKLHDDEISAVRGGLRGGALGGGLMLVGQTTAVLGILGFAASEIASTVYVAKANKALQTGNVKAATEFNKSALCAKIAVAPFGAGAIGGCILFSFGQKVCCDAAANTITQLPWGGLFSRIKSFKVPDVQEALHNPAVPGNA